MQAIANIGVANVGYSQHYRDMDLEDPLAPVLRLEVREEDVRGSIEKFGRHLREARLRRNMTIEQVAKLLKVGRGTIADAERGKATTGIGVYVGILWALGIGEQLHDLAMAHREEADDFSVNDGRRRARPGHAAADLGLTEAGDGEEEEPPQGELE